MNCANRKIKNPIKNPVLTAFRAAAILESSSTTPSLWVSVLPLGIAGTPSRDGLEVKV
jgi:hypothetical protein